MQIEQTKGMPWALTITLIRAGKPIYSWEGHEHSVFVVARDVLYYADFIPRRHGCAVIAYDLKSEKLLWKTDLWGIEVDGHSKYLNLINLEIADRHLIVYGNESFGRYIELLDLKTGKTVGNRVVADRNGVR